MSNLQAIIRKTFTESLTFAGKPSAETLQRLKTQGFRYENGNWFRTRSESGVILETEVPQHIAA